jgi:hypothetical protein
MMASGEIRLLPTMLRRMPVLAQGPTLQDIVVEASKYPALSSNFFLDPASWPGVSSWTILGNIAHRAAYIALLHANPALAASLTPEEQVDGGAIDFVLDDTFAYELKPMSWQYGMNYSSALGQLSNYMQSGGYSAGTWSALGINSAAVGVSGTFSMYGGTFNGAIIVGYDANSSTSGLLFYQTFGSFSFDRSVPSGMSNLAFWP